MLQKLVTLLITVHFTVLTPLWSAYTHAAETQDWTWIRRALRRSVGITVVLFGGGGLLAIWLHGPVLKLWTGRDLTDVGLMTLFVIWATLYAWINCFSVLLNGLHIIRLQTIVTLASAGIHIVLSIFLGQKFGLQGILWGSILSLVPMVVSNTWQVALKMRSETSKGLFA